MKSRFQTILAPEIANQAEIVIDYIASTLSGAVGSLTRGKPYWHNGTAAEFAMFFGCLAAATGRQEYRRQATRLAESAVELFPADAGLGLHGGLAGLAWTIQFLSRPPIGLGIDAEGICRQADELLLDRLLQNTSLKTWTDYDLISGFAGQGIYLLHRLPSKRAGRALKLIIARLEASSKKMRGGIAWHTPAHALPEHQRRVAPRGYYNLGLAHGLPGVIGFLAEAYRHGVEAKRALALMDRAVAWMFGQKLPPNPVSILPAWVGPGISPNPTRVAWCYGDLGVSVALLSAALATCRHGWKSEALTLGRKAAACPFRRSGVTDACLCHGAAGNGHLFHHLYRATGDETFLTAARTHFNRALRIRGPGQRLGGYSFWTTRDNSPDTAWGPDASLLSGISGVGLALLAATRPQTHGWDTPLLLGLD